MEAGSGRVKEDRYEKVILLFMACGRGGRADEYFFIMLGAASWHWHRFGFG
jgi:hypothetical protein